MWNEDVQAMYADMALVHAMEAGRVAILTGLGRAPRDPEMSADAFEMRAREYMQLALHGRYEGTEDPQVGDHS